MKPLAQTACLTARTSSVLNRLRRVVLAAGLAVLVPPGLAGVPPSAFTKDPYPQQPGPVKVFLLAGQSNMQGHAALRTLEYLIYNEATAADYQQWKDREGRWVERSDVWIWTTDGQRSGNLKPGFGANEWKLGPELGFGWTVGEHCDQQVLLIKTCWGGRSVKKDFLPPGASLPPEDALQKELENARKKNPDATLADVKANYGRAYRDMLAHCQEVLANLKQLFPKYNEQQGYELAGLVWFQGWNDMVDGAQRAGQYTNYTARLAQLIKDVRRDLQAPNLPVAIGELGVGGKRGDFQLAQAAVAQLPEFAGNVKCIPTGEFWEPDVEKLVNDNAWQGPDWVKFYNVGSERGYHYLGSARIYTRIGTALGQAMIEMMRKP